MLMFTLYDINMDQCAVGVYTSRHRDPMKESLCQPVSTEVNYVSVCTWTGVHTCHGVLAWLPQESMYMYHLCYRQYTSMINRMVVHMLMFTLYDITLTLWQVYRYYDTVSLHAGGPYEDRYSEHDVAQQHTCCSRQVMHVQSGRVVDLSRSHKCVVLPLYLVHQYDQQDGCTHAHVHTL